MYSQKFYLYPITLFSLLLGISSASAANLLSPQIFLQKSAFQTNLAFESQLKSKEDNSVSKNKGLWNDVKEAGEDVGEFGEDAGEDAAEFGEEAGEDALETGKEAGEDVGEFGENVGEDIGEEAEETSEDILD